MLNLTSQNIIVKNLNFVYDLKYVYDLSFVFMLKFEFLIACYVWDFCLKFFVESIF